MRLGGSMLGLGQEEEVALVLTTKCSGSVVAASRPLALQILQLRMGPMGSTITTAASWAYRWQYRTLTRLTPQLTIALISLLRSSSLSHIWQFYSLSYPNLTVSYATIGVLFMQLHLFLCEHDYFPSA